MSWPCPGATWKRERQGHPLCRGHAAGDGNFCGAGEKSVMNRVPDLEDMTRMVLRVHRLGAQDTVA